MVIDLFLSKLDGLTLSRLCCSSHPSPEPLLECGFKTQTCCLNIGPVASAMAIYLTLKHLVIAFGRRFPFLRPDFYTRLFIACNVISVIFQGVGAGLAFAAENRPHGPSIGDNTTMCGHFFQVLTLIMFASTTEPWKLCLIT